MRRTAVARAIVEDAVDDVAGAEGPITVPRKPGKRDFNGKKLVLPEEPKAGGGRARTLAAAAVAGEGARGAGTAAAGADTFVAGSAIFNAPDYADVISRMRANCAAAVAK